MRKLFLSLVLVAATSFAFAEKMGVFETYSTEAFKTAKQNGKSIVVHVHATWCGICVRQMKIINKLADSESYENVKFLQVLFKDTPPKGQKAFMSKYEVTDRSTILVFNGQGKLVSRLDLKTNPDKITDTSYIKRMIAKAVQ